jgi:hypothetical protein
LKRSSSWASNHDPLIYNSALAAPPQLDTEPVDGVIVGRLRAFVCDLGEQLPDAYDDADVIYGEPPFTVMEAQRFRLRAGVQCDRPVAWLSALHQAVFLKRPVVLVAGAHLAAAMPEPDDVRTIRFDGPGKHGQGVRARAFAWNAELPDVTLATRLIRVLAEQHATIGDPFCGFGRTGRIALAAGANVILSDVDPTCIAYIAAHAELWQ